MANQAEIDYEKQFQDDLAKATALSLEQQALDEYNRTKKYGAAFTQNAQQEATNKYYAQIRRQHYARGNSSDINSSVVGSQNAFTSASSTPQRSLALPKLQSQQAQRRHSEITHNIASSSSALLTDVERSKTPPASRAENDLINFASPTSKNPESTSFEKLIEDLQKLQSTNPQTALVPLGPTAAAPMYPPPTAYHTAAAAVAPMYAGSAAAVQPPTQYGVATATGALGMQLVPFVPTQQQQKVPLTNEELSKLYSMTPPHTAPVYGARPAHHIGFIPPMGTTGYYPATPPIMPGSAAYSAPMHYPNAYGFQFQAAGVAAQQHAYYPSNMTASAASSSSALSSASSMSGSAMNVHQLQHSMNATDNNNFNQHQQSHSNVYLHTTSASTSAPPASTTASAHASVASTPQANGLQNKRQTPPVRKPSRVPGSDLIDLSHEDDSRVSVLEAFDPLLHDSDEVTKRLNKH